MSRYVLGSGWETFKNSCIVIDSIVNYINLVFGMYVIDQFGGVLIDGCKVQYGGVSVW